MGASNIQTGKAPSYLKAHSCFLSQCMSGQAFACDICFLLSLMAMEPILIGVGMPILLHRLNENLQLMVQLVLIRIMRA